MLSAVLLLLLLVAPAAAATRHFAVTGSNQNPCTEAAPCLTAGPYEADAQPGDRFLFRRGDVFTGKQFQLLPVRSGTSAQPITYGAYGSGAPPLLDSGDPTMAGHGGADGLKATQTDWLIIEDLAFVGWGSALDLCGVRDVVVRRVVSTGGSSEACLHIRQSGGRPSERVTLEDVELAQCGVNSNGEGVYIGTNPGQEGAGDSTADITLRRVFIHDVREEGIEVKNCAQRVTIEASRFARIGQGEQGHGIALAPSSVDCPGRSGAHTIRRTLIDQASRRGIHLGTGGTISQVVVTRAGENGIHVEDLPGDDHLVTIEGSTTLGNTGAGIAVTESAAPHTTQQDNVAWGNGTGNDPVPPEPPQPPTPPAITIQVPVGQTVILRAVPAPGAGR